MQNLRKNSMMLIAALLLTIVVGCKKDDQDQDYSAGQENAIAENVYNDVANIIDDAYQSKSDAKGTSGLIIIGACATITLDTIAFPRTLTVDFGTTPCLCQDGRYRSGKIIAHFTGPYRSAGTVITITFDDYSVNDYLVNGTKTITNMGLNTNGNPYFKIDVTGTIQKPNNGGTISWNSTRTREWIEGQSTLTMADDVYLINGSGSGVTAAGTTYTISITDPLRKEIGCKHFVSGIFELDITGKALRTVDYGNGTCDNTATVTILSQTYTITLN
jgi:hypothetical protein